MLGLAMLLAVVASFTDADSIDGRHAAAPCAPEVFVENLGQFDSRSGFVCRSGSATIFATEGGFRFVTADAAGRGVAVFVDFDAAAGNAVEKLPEPIEPLPGLHHFFEGSDPAKWVSGARGFAGVLYRDVRPGVDVVLRARAGVPTVDFVIDPGVDPATLPDLALDGVDSLRWADDGSIVVATAIGSLVLTRPVTFATAPDGSSRTLASRFEIRGARALGVVVEGARCNERVVVDPDLVFATLLGVDPTSADEISSDVVVDASGSSIVTGWTTSYEFPVTPGAYDTMWNGQHDVYVTKFTLDGSALMFSTLIGGASYDHSEAIALGADGAVFVTGNTKSPNFPATFGAFDTTYSGGGYPDGFLVKLAANGSALVWSTYFGGVSNEFPHAVAVDSAGDAFVVGQSNSVAYPVTPGAYDTLNSGSDDGFVTKFAPDGSTLVYSTLLGASGVPDSANGIVLSGNGDVFVVGYASPGFPFTHETFDPSSNGGRDAFVVHLNAAGSGLVAGTFLGSTSDDLGDEIALGPDGSVYVAGETGTATFPTTPGAFDTAISVFTDVFVARFDPSLSALMFSTFLGSEQADIPSGLGVDAGGAAVVSGDFVNAAFNFPTTPGALETGSGGSFLSRLLSSGASLSYSTYVTSIGARTSALSVQGNGLVAVTGTTPLGFPVTPGAYDTTQGGQYDVYVAKFDLCPGAITSHGVGCVGSGGFTPALGVAGCASPGFLLTVNLTNVLGPTSALLLLGLGTTSLPLNGSCSLAIGPLVPSIVVPLTLLGAGPGAGAISFSATVPEVPAPVDLHLQVVVVDPNVAGGIAASNALRIRIDR